MKYHLHFEPTIEAIRREDRYRAFTDLERDPKRPPYVLWRRARQSVEVVMCCSNDYLAMTPTARRRNNGIIRAPAGPHEQ
jgi:7-keto-8-aminopelargonate synthetase-like enzyme